MFVLYERCDKVPERDKNKHRHDIDNDGNTRLSISILCEDVLENLRNATPCFIVAQSDNGGKQASIAQTVSGCRGGHQYIPAEFENYPNSQRGYRIQLQPGGSLRFIHRLPYQLPTTHESARMDTKSYHSPSTLSTLMYSPSLLPRGKTSVVAVDSLVTMHPMSFLIQLTHPAGFASNFNLPQGQMHICPVLLMIA